MSGFGQEQEPERIIMMNPQSALLFVVVTGCTELIILFIIRLVSVSFY